VHRPYEAAQPHVDDHGRRYRYYYKQHHSDYVGYGPPRPHGTTL